MIGISVLGSTGSIGVSTLDVAARHPDKYRVVALTANRDIERLAEQCVRFRPDYAVVADDSLHRQLEQKLGQHGLSTQVLSGNQALETVAALDEVDYVMAAIVGAAGLLPTLAAARAGKRILLANKESLVMSGQLLVNAVRENHAELLPIDSEHNAIFQCLPATHEQGLEPAGVEKILLTASGGPFLHASREELAGVTPEQACAHPNWDMGRKISVDSATMMNKGLEVIEACWLFETTPNAIQVVIHPQSIIHSMVQYVDGSVLAQLGNPDMRTPIAHAMAWPERMASGVEPLDVFQVAQLDFVAPDFERFPCLRLAYEAIERGGTLPAILNAANEVAVEAFLGNQIRFDQIPVIIEQTMQAIAVGEADSIETLLRADQQARDCATGLLVTGKAAS